MTIAEELIAQAQNFDKGSALRSLLERAAHHITNLDQPTAPTPLTPAQLGQIERPLEERRKPRKDV